MELAIILDNNTEDIEELKSVVLSLNPQIEFEVFSNVEEFSEWFHDLVEEPPEEKPSVSLLFSNRKILGQRHQSLFTKINTYMKNHGYLPEDKERIPILITAQNASEFKRETYRLDIFDNIIFKPFDAAVARGKINWALSGHDALSDEELTKQTPVSPLEMLKNVHIDRFTELGFRTISTERIPLGRLARYYIPSLKPLGEDYGVFASCTECNEQPNGTFICSFSFFGLDPIKLKNILKIIMDDPNNTELPLKNEEHIDDTGVIILSEEKDLSTRLRNSINSAFRSVDIVSFNSFIDFYSQLNLADALEEWLSGHEFTDTVVFEYTRKEGIFTRSYIASKEDQEIESYLELGKEQIINFKTLLLKNSDESLRHQISEYWCGPQNKKTTLILPGKGQNTYLTIEKSEKTYNDENGKYYLQIFVRPATEEELKKITKKSHLPDNPRLLLISERIFNARGMQFWSEINRSLSKKQNTEIIVIGKTPLSLYDQAKKYEGITDYLVEPYDHTYLKKRITQSIPDVEFAEQAPARHCSHTDETILVGVQVDIKNFSEVSISLEYSRELERNAFREFVIYIQSEKIYEELFAKHVDTEKLSDGVYLNHFTLFGHGEKTNQHIREWLNEQYALSKKELVPDSFTL